MAPPPSAVSPRIHRALDGLNFFLADVRDGLGPYLAIYLLAVRGPEQGWNPATIGFVITLAGLIGLAAQTPVGAFIDRSRHKRAVIIAAAVAVTLSCVVLPFITDFRAVVATQSLAAIAGTVFPPALAAITLGLVGPRAFSRRIGRNEAFNHAGNAASAALAAGTTIAARAASTSARGRSPPPTRWARRSARRSPGASSSATAIRPPSWRSAPSPRWASSATGG